MDDKDVIVGSSTTTGDNQADSPNADDVNSSSSEQQEKFVPYSRFQEVIAEKNESKEKLSFLEKELNEFKSKFTPQEQKQEEIPDVYDDPQGYAKYIEDRAIMRIKGERQAEEQALKEAEAFINSQLSEIKKTDKNIDEDKVCAFADEWGITNSQTGQPDLIRAHKLMKQLEGNGKDDTTRAKIAPVSTNSTSASSTGKVIPRNQLRHTSMEYLISKVAGEKG